MLVSRDGIVVVRLDEAWERPLAMGRADRLVARLVAEMVSVLGRAPSELLPE
jgi:hypothetical protein